MADDPHPQRRNQGCPRRDVLLALGGLPLACLQQVVYQPQVRDNHLVIPAERTAQLRGVTDVLVLRVPGTRVPLTMRRRGDGSLLVLQTVCTHRSCDLAAVPDGYECPCHGSRFDLEGRVIEGPAERPLAALPVRSDAQGSLIQLPEAPR